MVQILGILLVLGGLTFLTVDIYDIMINEDMARIVSVAVMVFAIIYTLLVYRKKVRSGILDSLAPNIILIAGLAIYYSNALEIHRTLEMKYIVIGIFLLSSFYLYEFKSNIFFVLVMFIHTLYEPSFLKIGLEAMLLFNLMKINKMYIKENFKLGIIRRLALEVNIMMLINSVILFSYRKLEMKSYESYINQKKVIMTILALTAYNWFKKYNGYKDIKISYIIIVIGSIFVFDTTSYQALGKVTTGEVIIALVAYIGYIVTRFKTNMEFKTDKIEKIDVALLLYLIIVIFNYNVEVIDGAILANIYIVYAIYVDVRNKNRSKIDILITMGVSIFILPSTIKALNIVSPYNYIVVVIGLIVIKIFTPKKKKEVYRID